MCKVILFFLSFQIERLVELSSNLAIKEWRRLPHIVTHIHVPLLQVGYVRGCPMFSIVLVQALLGLLGSSVSKFILVPVFPGIF
jgi:hypothetical protein